MTNFSRLAENKMIIDEEEKPPSEPPGNLCLPAPDRVCACLGYWGATWGRKVGNVWGVPSPDLRARFRNELALLEDNGGVK